MAQVLVRNLEDEVVERLKARAAAAGRSLEAELRDIVTAAAKPSKAETLRALARIRSRVRQPGPGEPNVVDMIREDRDSR